jgi:hypothetical protein
MTRLQYRQRSVGTVTKLHDKKHDRQGETAVKKATCGAADRYEQQTTCCPAAHRSGHSLLASRFIETHRHWAAVAGLPSKGCGVNLPSDRQMSSGARRASDCRAESKP